MRLRVSASYRLGHLYSLSDRLSGSAVASAGIKPKGGGDCSDESKGTNVNVRELK